MTKPTVWPSIPTDERLTTPALSRDGQHVYGWVRRPDGPWRPADLLWLPPTATKSTDVDEAGRIVDVEEFDLVPDHAWITAQLSRRQRYLDRIREHVRTGKAQLSPVIARMLGLDNDGAQLWPSRLATAKALRDEAFRLIDAPRNHKPYCYTGHPADESCQPY